MKRTLILLLLVLTLFSVCSVGASFASADEVEGTEGIYLLGTTSMDCDSSRLFFSQNFYSSGDVTRSCVKIYLYENGSFVDSGRAVDFSGEIKKIRCGLNRLFVHIGDTLYSVDLNDCLYTVRIIACQSELLTFEANESNIYCVFRSDSDEYKLSVTPIKNLDDEAYMIPSLGNLLPFSSVADIHSNGSYLYILNEEGSLLKRNFYSSSDVVYKDLSCGDELPEKVFTVFDKTVLFNGNTYAFINDNGELTEAAYILDAGENAESVIDMITIDGRAFVLNKSSLYNSREVQELKFEENELYVIGTALRGNTIVANLPDFEEYTFGNTVLSGQYEMVYAISYPSNVVYTYDGDTDKYGKDTMLTGRIIAPNEPILILNYDTAEDFYLIMYNGRLGYIEKHDSTLAIVHDVFKEVSPSSSHRHRKNANQTLSVFSLPSTDGANAFLIDNYRVDFDNSIQVKVCYELNGFEAEGVKWVYASFIDDSGVIRYGFMLSGDLTDSENNEISYTMMKANPKFGQKLKIYESNTPLSEEVVSLVSGTIVNVYDEIEEQDNELMMCYVKVQMQDGTIYSGYVYKSSLIERDDLSIYQQFGIAIVITAVFVAIAAVIMIKYIGKNKVLKVSDVVKGDSLSYKSKNKADKKNEQGFDEDWY